uniref:Putative lipid exporter abca1 n=1 Tax=Xenopsylla cheopis TaxID=163159 RepID=A0A6M2DJ84_XENCH
MDAETEPLPPLPQVKDSDLALRRRQLKSQQSTVASRKQHAVCVRGAHKQYGSSKNPNIILDGLNMTVPKGSIYGLLGASGCGKTTLLSCIVGRRRLNQGEIWVLGGTPGSRGSGVPGPRIGYMPQEIALYGEFSIRETMIYFGWISGMTTSEVDGRIDFLLDFLQLPAGGRMVKSLSGGQQRRVSLAAALLHQPELLILDEPTVGVDPVLRQGIWDHLVDITQGGKTTVIITTHYIEETRQAHMIGLMRGGKFLAEESPAHLMQQYRTDTLEAVFLKLSVLQNMGKRRRSSILQQVTERIEIPHPATDPAIELEDEEIGEISGEFGDNISMSSRGGVRGSRGVVVPGVSVGVVPPLPPEEAPEFNCWDRAKLLQTHHMKALIWKNFLWMWRNVGVMAFIIGLPVAQIVLFCLSIGHDPVGLHMAVFNGELNTTLWGDEARTDPSSCPVTRGCNQTLLSCRYLSHLRDRKAELEFYADEDLALEAVRRGKVWGSIVFAHNYTESLVERMEQGRNAPDDILAAADIDVTMDMSNQQIGTLLYRDIQYAFGDFIKQLLRDCDIDPNVGNIPLQFRNPVFGDQIPNFTDFAAPGVILTIIFFLSVALTSGAMLLERNEGLLERSLVSGITGVEILFSHVTTQFLVMCGQTALVLIFSFAVFGLSIKGSVTWITILTILTGLCGMCFGFVVSCSCENERSATYMAMGSFLPIVMLCGIIWPIEGMHQVLRYISYILPLTKSTESLRSMLQRGWSIHRPQVYYGFLSTFGWCVVFLTVSILLLKFKKG